MKGVIGHADKQDESTAGEGKIALQTAQVATDHIILSPYLGNDFLGEGIRT
jgi:hypothetical protein